MLQTSFVIYSRCIVKYKRFKSCGGIVHLTKSFTKQSSTTKNGQNRFIVSDKEKKMENNKIEVFRLC